MNIGLRLEGKMIPRRVKRMFDERGEPRDEEDAAVLLIWRGTALAGRLVNLSPSGAMVSCDEIPHIGETVALQPPGCPSIAGVVRWVRDGRIGVHFRYAVEAAARWR